MNLYVKPLQRLLCLVLLAVLCTGCSKVAFEGTDITGANFGGDFTLVDHHGKARRLADFQGKVVALFFGYTHCPDVCPLTMAEYAAVMKNLGNKAADVQVLFVSLDPERDTPTLLAQYVPAFNPTFVGLTGTPQQVAAVAGQYKVIYQKQGAGANYTLDHSAGSFLLDKKGRLRVLENYGASPAVLTKDITTLIEE
ncbi:SCO family protein [Silvimonas amylolytica]|uniref:Photosynthetic protein synthase I n=1 Tax=Silvimonas amylolytica TaxID=449663 RepID=A0ABQ2PKQ1_9NEIS|nr:SCO family protein [Silvimonas amylolytica]GGP26187.1 photosynthetic protein synthase I [Silvimonas amylolytica]